MPDANRNRERTDLTLDPALKAWASKYGNARHCESLSRFIERLLRAERARAADRARKTGVLTPFERHFKIEREMAEADRSAVA